jgi:SOS-response transcriptional repressor LexA
MSLNPIGDITMPTSFMNAGSLTDRQAQLCATIDRLATERGYPPSMSEVADEMRFSISRIAELARSAERKGALTRAPGIARSWRVVKPEAKATTKRSR